METDTPVEIYQGNIDIDVCKGQKVHKIYALHFGSQVSEMP